MTEYPLALQQLINITAGELGLGSVERHTLGLALIRAYNLGVKNANTTNNTNAPGPR